MISLCRSRRTPLVLVPIAFLALAGGCRESSPNGNALTNGSAAKTDDELSTAAPLAEAALDRQALLSAVALAASSASLGQDDTVRQRVMEGKPFEIRLRFGCSGPASDLKVAPSGWTYDPGGRVLRVRATPTLSGSDAGLKSPARHEFEAAEGFWFPRPWMLQSGCPAEGQSRADDANSQASVANYPRVGIAQFFMATDSRTARRDGRPYEATRTLSAGADPVGRDGFDLVLSGRLRAVPQGKVIECAATGIDTAPDCVVGAEFDRVWIEDPRNRELIAEWASG